MTLGWILVVIDAQEKNAVIYLFLQYKKKHAKSEWNDISAQGAEFKSFWASLVIDGGECWAES